MSLQDWLIQNDPEAHLPLEDDEDESDALLAFREQ
jgi:hypothetical protein